MDKVRCTEMDFAGAVSSETRFSGLEIAALNVSVNPPASRLTSFDLV
jgi:hypothetical protein